MKARYILDTNTFSYIVSGASQTARAHFRRLATSPEARLSISVVTEAEVRFGMNKRALSPARRNAIEGVFATLEILPWGSQEAAIYAKALPLLQAAGIGVSVFDLLIGAHAASTGAVLVSHDGIFPRIAKLTGIHMTVDWATDL